MRLVSRFVVAAPAIPAVFLIASIRAGDSTGSIAFRVVFAVLLFVAAVYWSLLPDE